MFFYLIFLQRLSARIAIKVNHFKSHYQTDNVNITYLLHKTLRLSDNQIALNLEYIISK